MDQGFGIGSHVQLMEMVDARECMPEMTPPDADSVNEKGGEELRGGSKGTIAFRNADSLLRRAKRRKNAFKKKTYVPYKAS